MLCLCKKLTGGGAFFSSWDHIILAEAVLERIPIFAMKEGNPAGLFAQVLQDGVILLGEDPDALLGMAAREGQLREHILLLGHSF